MLPRLSSLFGLKRESSLKGYGFRWQPNKALADFKVTALTDTDAPGLFLGFEDETIDESRYFFDDPAYGLGIIFGLPPNPAPAFAQAVQSLVTNQALKLKLDDALLRRLEGFLNYTNRCLNYLYGTLPGIDLLDKLIKAPKRIYIKPSRAGNEIIGKGDKYCSIANILLPDKLSISQQQQTQLFQMLAKASGSSNLQLQCQWLADQVNEMPLYSMYLPAPYPVRFLATNNERVTAEGLEQWFTIGSSCPFITNLENRQKILGVPILNFVKLAVIVALYDSSESGTGGDSDMYFDVHDYSNNTLRVPRTLNTVLDRPPAIGLAHELIHAYYNAIGREPGREANSFSTTLAELICVGLGPWQANPISENQIRMAWPPAKVSLWPPGGDPLNNRAVGLRLIYEPVPPGSSAEEMRVTYI